MTKTEWNLEYLLLTQTINNRCSFIVGWSQYTVYQIQLSRSQIWVDKNKLNPKHIKLAFISLILAHPNIWITGATGVQLICMLELALAPATFGTFKYFNPAEPMPQPVARQLHYGPE